MTAFSKPPGASTNPTGPPTSYPAPRDKLEALHQLYAPGFPPFPIAAEVEAMIDDELPGELPRSLSEYIVRLHARMTGQGDVP